MSGPKAFRIVTRAEIILICRRSLARLDAAIEFWASTCKRNGTIDQKDIDRVIPNPQGGDRHGAEPVKLGLHIRIDRSSVHCGTGVHYLDPVALPIR